MKLTEHFCLAEFEYSATASKLGIDNTIPEALIPSIKNLCVNVLEPLRDWYGGPVTIGSGYRCQRLNSAVGGVSGSQHTKGEAADLHLPSMEAGRRWFDYIKENLPFDQLIWERAKFSPSKGKAARISYWIHVSFSRTRNRHKVIPLLDKHNN